MALTLDPVASIDADLASAVATAKQAADVMDWATWAGCYDEIDALLDQRLAARVTA